MTFPNRLDRELLALAVPALGALAIDPLVTLVDTAFVGRLGVVPLAALGIDAAIFSLAFVVFNFLAYGTTPRVARALGHGDREGAGRIVVQALVVAVALGLVATGILVALAVPLVGIMGASGEVVGPAVEYLRIRAIAGPAVLLVTAGHGAFRGHHDTRTPLLVTLAMNGINLVLDPVLIFGAGWGLAGAAWATVAAQWTGAAGFLWLILARRRSAMGIELVLPSLRELLPFLRIGAELVVRTLSLIGALTLATAVAARVGIVAVAAHQVASQVWLLLALVLDSLAVAAQAMVARRRGAGDAASARAAGRRLLLWGIGIGIVNGIAIALLRPWIPRLFTSDPAAIDTVDRVLDFVIWMQPLNALVFVWDGVFLGAERFRYLAGQMVVAGLVAAAVLLLVVPMGWGLVGVWWGIVALMAARAITLAAGWWGPLARVAGGAAIVVATLACEAPPREAPPRETRAPDRSETADSLVGACTPDAAADLVERSNDARADRGLARLEPDARLFDAAAAHAEDLSRRGILEHAGVDGSTIGGRARAAGYRWTIVAENLATGQIDPDAVVRTWLDSPGHRTNLLDPDVRHVGAEHARGIRACPSCPPPMVGSRRGRGSGDAEAASREVFKRRRAVRH